MVLYASSLIVLFGHWKPYDCLFPMEIATYYRVGKRTEVIISIVKERGKILRRQKMHIIANTVEGTETKKNIR